MVAELGDHRRPVPVLPAEQHARARHRSAGRCSFAALELALDARDESRPHVLQITHSRLDATGGTEKYVAALLGTLDHEYDFSVLYPVESGFVLRTNWIVGGRRVEREFLLSGAANQVTRMNDEVAHAALLSALDLFDFDAVHIHNLIGHSLAPFDALADFDGPVVCSVHDLFLACPNFSLLYMKTRSVRDPRGSLGVRALPRRHRRVADAGFAADGERLARVPRRVPHDGLRSGSTPSTTGCSRARARPTTSCASTRPSPIASRSSSTAR